jgi:hypothetical protein
MQHLQSYRVIRTAFLLAPAALVGFVAGLPACGGDGKSSPPPSAAAGSAGAGGASASGGAVTAAGGTTSTGGSAASVGGAAGTSNTGGAAPVPDPGFTLEQCLDDSAGDLAKYEAATLNKALTGHVGGTVRGKKYEKDDAGYVNAVLGALVTEWMGQLDTGSGEFKDLKTKNWTAWDGAQRTTPYQAPISNSSLAWQEHLYRVYVMLQSWRRTESPHHLNPELLAKIKEALDAYVLVPRNLSDKWNYLHTWGDLFETWLLGEACLFAKFETNSKDRFRQQDIDRWSDHIPDIFALMPLLTSGWNMTATARGVLASKMALGDRERRTRETCNVIKHIWDGVALVTAKDAMGRIGNNSADGMLGEHQLLMAGAYGNWFVGDVSRLYETTRDWPYLRMTAAARKTFRMMLLEGQIHSWQGTGFDRNLFGRNVDYNAYFPAAWLNTLLDSDPAANERVYAAQAWLEGKTDFPFPERSMKAFYTVDFYMKHFPKTAVSWHGVSDRTTGAESFDNKPPNRYRAHAVLFPYGSSFVRRTGNEYPGEMMRASFDYGRPPGVTSKWVDVPTIESVWNSYPDGSLTRYIFGGADFAGGVEAGATGVASFHQDTRVGCDWNTKTQDIAKWTPISVKGTKAVFFLADAVVHLGAGYDTRGNAAFATVPTVTSLEQRAANGGTDLVYGAGQELSGRIKSGAANTIKDAQLTWAWYANTGYLLPADGVKNVAVDGKQVLSLFSDHGFKNTNLSFEWAVLPDVSEASMLTFVKPWRVLVNTPALQALSVPGRGWVGAVFHDAKATLDAKTFTLRVDHPVILVVTAEGNGYRVFAADPRHDRNRNGLTLRVTLTPPGKPARVVNVALPGGDHPGKTASAQL